MHEKEKGWHWSLQQSGNSNYVDKKLIKMHIVDFTTHLHSHPGLYLSHLLTGESHLHSADQLHHQGLAH